MRRATSFVLLGAITSCTTLLGVDGEYDDSPGNSGGTTASGGNSGSGGAPTGGMAGADAAAGQGGASATGGGGVGATGGASGGAGGGTGGGSTGGGGAGGGGAAEVCGNGQDDDADGKFDCADTDCANWKCAPSAPSPWVGPMQLWSGASSAAPPVCPGSAITSTVLEAPSADCSGISCSCQASGTCTASATVTYYDSTSSCTGKVVGNVSLNGATCFPYAVTEAVGGAKASVTTNDTQKCTPSTAGSGDVPPAVLEKKVVLCPRTGGPVGCTSGSCVELLSGYSTLCVYRSGNSACPAGYPNRVRAGTSIKSDSRGCSPCGCSGPFCYVTAKDFASGTCGGGSASVFSTCGGVWLPDTLSRGARLSIDPGTCTATGGSSTGSVTLNNELTICCL